MQWTHQGSQKHQVSNIQARIISVYWVYTWHRANTNVADSSIVLHSRYNKNTRHIGLLSCGKRPQTTYLHTRWSRKHVYGTALTYPLLLAFFPRNIEAKYCGERQREKEPPKAELSKMSKTLFAIFSPLSRYTFSSAFSVVGVSLRWINTDIGEEKSEYCWSQYRLAKRYLIVYNK